MEVSLSRIALMVEKYRSNDMPRGVKEKPYYCLDDVYKVTIRKIMWKATWGTEETLPFERYKITVQTILWREAAYDKLKKKKSIQNDMSTILTMKGCIQFR
jgi:hypothetical protein